MDSPETQSVVPVTPLQRGLLFHHVSASEPGVDVQQVSMRLYEPLDIIKWKAAWQATIRHFDTLRSRFSWTDEGANRIVLIDFQLPVVELSWSAGLSDGDLESAVNELMRRERTTSLDPLSIVPQRMTVVHLAESDHLVLWTFHHALLDGRSFVRVLSEVFDRYDGFKIVFDTPSDFGAYIKHVGMPVSDSTRAFWKSRVGSMEAICGFRSTSVQNTASNISANSSFQLQYLNRDESCALRDLATRAGCSVHSVLQAAWALLLCHHNRQEQICFGTVRACRHSVDNAADMVGLLINTVPFVISVPRNASVLAVLQMVKKEQLALRSVETTPLSAIQVLAPFQGGPVFETAIMFDSESLDTRMRQLDSERFANRHFTYEGQTNFPVTLIAYGDDQISLRLEHYTSYLTTGSAADLMAELQHLLRSLSEVQDLASTVAMSLPYLSQHSLKQMAQWNATDVDYGAFQPLQQSLQQQALTTPLAIALQFENQSLTYQEFDGRVNQLANYLQEKGVGVGDVVGLLVERSLELLVSVHAVVRCGAAFLPLDSEFPEDRLDYMVSNAKAVMVMHQGNLADRCQNWQVPLVNLSAPATWQHCDIQAPAVNVAPTDAAYVLYTSGSTGRPKGVVNTHQGIVNRLQWMQEALELGADDVVLQKTPCSFDVSVWELFWPFMVGARLVIAQPKGHRDPAYLCSLIQSEKVTVMHFVPSMLQLFLDEPAVVHCQGIRQIICSGEALPMQLQQRVFSLLTCRLHNLYGPTEAAIDVTWWECDAQSVLPYVPLGKPVANTQLHVLDATLHQVPVGVAGELCIGGVQVAKEYVSQPELTAERFIPDPFRSGGTLYRTGDLARWSADGMLEYLGRLDHQVKIRGQRVELGEIEQVLLSHDSVREVVVAATTAQDGQGRLTAYVVPGADSAELARYASAHLPGFMVPARWVSLDEFPLNASGKVDRARLPEPAELEVSRTVGEADSNLSLSETQSIVLELWQNLLGVANLSIDDRFLDSGGDSLSLLRLRNQLRERVGLDLSVTELLANSSIRQQASLAGRRPQAGAGPVASASNKNNRLSDDHSANQSSAEGVPSGDTALETRVRQRQQAMVNRRKQRSRGEQT